MRWRYIPLHLIYKLAHIKNVIKWGSGARLDIFKSISYNTLSVMMVLRVVNESTPPRVEFTTLRDLLLN